MLKQLSLAVLITALMSGSAMAGDGRNQERITREVKLNAGFTKIIVNGDADLLLVEGGSLTAIIEDEAAEVNKTRISTQNGVLTVQVTRNRNKRPVIKLPVRSLQMIEINGDGYVQTVSSLKSANLNVLINGACKIALRVIGNISLDVTDDFEYEYIKNERIRIVREAE